MADVWWMENGSDLCDELTRERDEARAERDRLAARVSDLEAVLSDLLKGRHDTMRDLIASRTAAQEVRRAWDAFHAHEVEMPVSVGRLYDSVSSAIDALCPPQVWTKEDEDRAKAMPREDLSFLDADEERG